MIKQIIWKAYGLVRDYTTTISKDSPKWINHPEGRAAVFENQGATSAFLTSQGSIREIKPLGAWVLAGYSDSTRFAQYDISFTGGAGKLLITEDIQKVVPVLLIDGVEHKVEICNKYR